MDTLANRGRILFLTALAAFLPAASFCAVRPEAYGRLPLRFEPNMGQADPQVRFLARSQGMTVLFTDSEAVMVIEGDSPSHARSREVVRMKLAGAARASHAAGLEKLPGVSNYFIGNDPAKWRTNIPNYARVRYHGIYPGVDLICYGKGRRLEYDLVVAPWADPKQIELAWEGVDHLELNKDGDLVLATRLGDVLQKRPRVYQETGGRKVPIAASYALRGGRRVAFDLARYDRNRPLVIDPVTEVYGTYLGGSNTDVGSSVAVDAAGSAYIAGYTYSTNFPIQGPYQSSNFESTYGNPTIFVTKLAPTGNALDYSTYLGGTGLPIPPSNNQSYGDQPSAIAVDGSGAVYITGQTFSSDFPTQLPLQAVNNGGGNGTAFVAKLAPAGNALAYSTYLGGSGGDDAYSIAVDATGAAYIAGYTVSTDFPTQSPYQASNNVAGNPTGFVTKLAPAGNTLAYSTYLGGTGGEIARAITVDRNNSAYVAGYTISTDFPTVSPYQASNNTSGNVTCFVTKMSAGGNALVYSTYLGGTTADYAYAIAVDGAGSAYVAGVAASADFPTLTPIQNTNLAGSLGNGFVTKLSTAGNALVYSTYLGGDADQGGGRFGDGIYSIAVDTAGEAYVAGWTNSSNFPTLSAFQSANGGNQDGFAAKLTAAGSALVFSTYLGGSDVDLCQAVAVDSSGAAYVTGYTHSSDFPVVAGYQTANGGAWDVFVAKLQLASSQNTITTSPAGLTVVVDGVSLTAPQTLSWTIGSSRSISVPSPQASGGARNTFSSWSDGGAQTHNVTAVTGGGTFTASFTTQYLLTTAVVGNGTIAASPTSADGYYSSGATVQLTAAANSGYKFNGWGGDLSGTANPQSLTMAVARSVTAAFISSTTTTALSFYPVTPCRVADTRGNGKSGSFGPPSMSGGSTRVFPISTSGCGVPSTAQAYSLNVTVVPAGQLTYLTMWPTGQAQPAVSTLNDFSTQAATPGNVLANAAIVPAGTSGSVSIFVSDTSDVIIDVNGYFAAPGTGGLAFYPVTPCRVADTRGNGKSGSFGPPTMAAASNRSFPIPTSGCNVPATAQAYSLNMTVVPTGQLTYLTTWPTGQSQPVVSTLNDFSTQSSTLDLGRVVANAAIVPAGTSGGVSVFVSDASDVIIDINGYFATPGGSGALSFYAAAPCRVADTRGNGFSGAFGAPSMAANGTRGFPIPVSACNIPNTAQAYSLNLTVLPPNQLIYLSTWPAGQSQPVVSTLNDFSTGTVVPGRVVANAAIVPAGTNGAVNVFTSDVTDLIIDINGYFAP